MSNFGEDYFGPTTGARYRVISKDGNCLFAAISFGFSGTVELAEQLRGTAVDHVDRFWEFYFPSVTSLCEPHSSHRPVAFQAQVDAHKGEYRKTMSKKGEWGSTVEISALAKVLERRIIVLQAGLVVCDVGPITNAPWIVLRFSSGNHYDVYPRPPQNVDYSRPSSSTLECPDEPPAPPPLQFGTPSNNEWPPLPGPSKRPKVPQPRNPKKGRNTKSPTPSDTQQIDAPVEVNTDHGMDTAGANDFDNISLSSAECCGDISDTGSSDSDIPNVPQPQPQPRPVDVSNTPPVLRNRPWVLPSHIVRTRRSITQVPQIRATYRSAELFGCENVESIQEVTLGEDERACDHCGARYWPSMVNRITHTSARCCDLGKLFIEDCGEFGVLPDNIQALYDGTHPKSKHFFNYIIPYNKIFQTVYSKGRFDNVGRGNESAHCLNVNGEVKYVSSPFETCAKRRRADGTLEILPGTINQGHIFFLELTVDTIRQRITNSSVGEELDPDLVMVLERYLRGNNKFIQWFQYTKEVYEHEKQLAAAENREVKEVVLVVNPKNVTTDMRVIGSSTYRNAIFQQNYVAAPVNDFVAAVFTGEVPEYSYDLKFFPRPYQPLHDRFPYPPHVSERTLDTMMYPLLYLHGEICWLKHKQKPNYSPTIQEYAKFRLARRDRVPILFKTQRLFLHWLINQQLRAEYDRLEYYRLHQSELRLDTYKNIRDFATTAAAQQNKDVGRMIIIPPDFEGTSKHSRELFLDFLAIIAKFGPPSWFTTFTCNTKWAEIQTTCEKEGCKPKFRPDITNDVFCEKYHSFMSDMVHDQMAGRVVAWFTVFEAQNRLLMHAHTLFILHDTDRPLTPEEVDRFVWSRFPDQETQPELFNLVKTFHVHGPCNKERGGSYKWPCKMNGNECRFGFPKQFRENTFIDSKVPELKRPCDGRGFSKYINSQIVFIDNRWIGNFSPVFLLRYRNHIDYQFTPKKGSVRYLPKYFTKAAYTERVHITQKNAQNPNTINFEYDEVKAYKEMRSLGAPEAHFRLTGHSLSETSVPVEKLPVHLPDNQNMVFKQGEWQQALDRNPETKLTAWFTLNQENIGKVEYQNLRYTDVVEKHTFKQRSWKRVSTCRRTIGRLCTVEPSIHSMETFYLRLLLLHQPGRTSFAHLRTVNGIEYDTYQQACIALGILEDDDELSKVLAELENIASAFQLRRCFANILVFCTPKHPTSVWITYADALSADYFYQSRDRENSMRQALTDIANILDQIGVKLEKYSLPQPETFQLDTNIYPQPPPLNAPPPAHIFESAPTRQHHNSDEAILNDYCDEVLTTVLNDEQQSFVQLVKDALDNKTDKRLFFLSAPGGTGKTTVLSVIAAHCHTNRIETRNVAYTGIAAGLLIRGQTSHRAFGIPLNKEPHETTTSNIKLQSKEAQDLANVELIMWDECSMIAGWQLEVVDHLMRKVKNCDLPFGGCVVILAGDLRQLPPVVKNASRAELLEESIVCSRLWPLFHPVSLTTNMRIAPGEEEWGKFILDIAEGRLNIPNTEEIDIPSDLIEPSLEDLMSFVFNDFTAPDTLSSVIICPTNEGADEINNIALQKFSPEVHQTVFYSATSFIKDPGADDNASTFSPEFLQSKKSGSIPHHEISLKPGVPILLIRNLNPAQGLCNGTRMIVERIFNHSILCRISSGLHKGEIHFIPRITFITREFGLPGRLKRVQLPIKVAYGITINRSQGQTFRGKVGIYLKRAPFSHEMLYVAVSRGTRRSLIKICVIDTATQGNRHRGVGGNRTGPKVIYTQNPIYFEILKHIPGFEF